MIKNNAISRNSKSKQTIETDDFISRFPKNRFFNSSKIDAAGLG